jgi:hypothetical protein
MSIRTSIVRIVGFNESGGLLIAGVEYTMRNGRSLPIFVVKMSRVHPHAASISHHLKILE